MFHLEMCFLVSVFFVGSAKRGSVECHLHALMCQYTVVFVRTMEND